MRPIFLHQFKANPSGLAKGLPAAATFLSSGTTGEQRSTVVFSAEGLANYKKRSLETIEWVLAHHLTGSSPGKLYSLIPSIEEWKTSSLARMVHWFGEKYGIEYIENSEGIPSNKPVWVFGTALHYAQTIEQHKPKKLHPKTLLFETGGFKGKRSQVSKADLYQSISRFFKLEENNIISEYGSCELSAQAYDSPYLPGNQTRRFCFHPSVKVGVLEGGSQIACEGVGSLSVDDPLRADIGAPIITEDLVELNSAGQFNLLGRVNPKKLRGCSLFAEADHEQRSLKNKTSKNSELEVSNNVDSRIKPSFVPHNVDFLKAQQRAKKLDKILSNKDLQKKFEQTLTEEITSAPAARKALDCFLIRPLAEISDSLEQVYLNAFGSCSPRKWDVILPGNHSIAGWEPLLLAAIFDKEVNVYLPPVEQVRKSCKFFIEEVLSLCGARVLAHNRDWTPSAAKEACEQESCGVLVFGRDATIDWFSRHTSRLAGHGTKVMGVQAELLDTFKIKELISANFSLGQTGCLEARFLVVQEPPTADFIQSLHREFLGFWGQPLTMQQQQALLHEKNAFETMHPEAVFYPHQGSVLPIFLSSANTLDEVLSSAQFCLPIITQKTFSKIKNKQSVLVTTVTEQTKSIVFNGVHQGNGFFI